MLGAFCMCVSLPGGVMAKNDKSQEQEKGAVFPFGNSKRISPEQWEKMDALLEPSSKMRLQAEQLLQAGDVVGAEQAANKSLKMLQELGPLGEMNIKSLQRVIGDIHLAKGEYKKALDAYAVNIKISNSMEVKTGIALCFIRMNNYEMALNFYSDQYILQYSSMEKKSLPGTNSNRALEASILLARGMDFSTSGRNTQALADFEAACKLVPNNGLALYCSGLTFARLHRDKEAEDRLRSAIQYGKGNVLKQAQSELNDLRKLAESKKAWEEQQRKLQKGAKG